MIFLDIFSYFSTKEGQLATLSGQFTLGTPTSPNYTRTTSSLVQYDFTAVNCEPQFGIGQCSLGCISGQKVASQSHQFLLLLLWCAIDLYQFFCCLRARPKSCTMKKYLQWQCRNSFCMCYATRASAKSSDLCLRPKLFRATKVV